MTICHHDLWESFFMESPPPYRVSQFQVSSGQFLIQRICIVFHWRKIPAVFFFWFGGLEKFTPSKQIPILILIDFCSQLGWLAWKLNNLIEMNSDSGNLFMQVPIFSEMSGNSTIRIWDNIWRLFIWINDCWGLER